MNYEEIAAKITQIENTINSLKVQRREFQDAASESFQASRDKKREWDEIIRDIVSQLTETSQKEVLALIEKQHNYQDEIAATNQEINKLQLEFNKLTVDLAREMEKRQLATRLEEASRSIKELASDTIWYQKAMPFQQEDIAFTVSAYLSGLTGVLNANDMSLGKTMETAASMFILQKLFEMTEGRSPRMLWLTKKSLTDSNVREIRKWLGTSFTPVIVRGTPELRRFAIELGVDANQLIVANHEAVRTTPLMQEIKWDFVFIDEVHKLKGGANASGPTEVWKSVKNVCRSAKFTIMLSGTPIVNEAQDMWSYLHIFAPDRFPNVKRFNQEFINPDGSVDFERIIKALKSQCFRRRKDEIKDQLHKALGDKNRLFYYLERGPEQDKVYQMAKQAVLSEFADMDPGTKVGIGAMIAVLTRCRQINVWPAGVTVKDPISGQEMTIGVRESNKIDETMDILQQLRAEGEQAVVFSAQFNEPLHEVQRRCHANGWSCEVLEGKTVGKVGLYEEMFQNGEIDVLCINSATGSEGLNLQKNPDEWKGGSSNAIFLDLWYSPARNLQGEDRLWRFGSDETVNIHILQNEHSVDALIAEILERKTNMIEGVMEADELRSPAEWKSYLEGLI